MQPTQSTTQPSLDSIIQNQAKNYGYIAAPQNKNFNVAPGLPNLPGQNNPPPADTTPPQSASATADQQSADTYGAWFPSATTDNPLTAGAKAAGNLIPSAGHLAGGVLNMVMHPIKTAEGLGSAALGAGQELSNTVAGTKFNTGSTQTWDQLKSAFVDRYGSLENLQRTATNDPVGFGADVAAIFTGGAALADSALGGTEAANAVRGATAAAQTGTFGEGAQAASAGSELGQGGLFSNALKETAAIPGQAVTKAAKAIVNNPLTRGALNYAAGGVGTLTGNSAEEITTGLKAGMTGGEAQQSYLDALRGNTTPEQIRSQAVDAVDSLQANNRTAYQDAMSKINEGETAADGTVKTYNPSSIIDIKNKILKDYNINSTYDTDTGSNTYDFSNSKLLDEQGKVNKALNIVDHFSGRGQLTADQLDTMKQQLSDLYDPSSKSRAAIQTLQKGVGDFLNKNVSGYKDTMSVYSDSLNSLRDIRQSLSLGDRAATDTGIRKLMSILRQNIKFRKAMVGKLEEGVPNNLREQIAGTNLSSWAPRGLAKYIDAGLGAGAVSGGVGLHLLPLIALSSPRVVGELLNLLGMTGRGAGFVGKAGTMLGTGFKVGALAHPAVEAANSSSGGS